MLGIGVSSNSIPKLFKKKPRLLWKHPPLTRPSEAELVGSFPGFSVREFPVSLVFLKNRSSASSCSQLGIWYRVRALIVVLGPIQIV
jgi:hypothetical protein